MENYLSGILDDDIPVVIEYAAEMESVLKSDADERFCKNADKSYNIDDVNCKNGQWYSALVGPLVVGRSLAVLKTIIEPGRCRIENLACVI